MSKKLSVLSENTIQKHWNFLKEKIEFETEEALRSNVIQTGKVNMVDVKGLEPVV